MVELARHRQSATSVMAVGLDWPEEQVEQSLRRLLLRGVVEQTPVEGNEPVWDFTARDPDCSTARVAASVIMVLRDRPRGASLAQITELLGEPEERVRLALSSLAGDRLAFTTGDAVFQLWFLSEPALRRREVKHLRGRSRRRVVAPRRPGPGVGER